MTKTFDFNFVRDDDDDRYKDVYYCPLDEKMEEILICNRPWEFNKKKITQKRLFKKLCNCAKKIYFKNDGKYKLIFVNFKYNSIILIDYSYKLYKPYYKNKQWLDTPIVITPKGEVLFRFTKAMEKSNGYYDLTDVYKNINNEIIINTQDIQEIINSITPRYKIKVIKNK